MKNKMKKYAGLLLLILFGAYTLRANPPKPPQGKRWVINTLFSDEFNGTQLDTSKWLDHHPTWIGRAPGLFMPSQVSVKNGCLQIKGEKMKNDTIVHSNKRNITFNIKGGAVVSTSAAFLGYYECRIKAAATTMSTTFWFSGGGGTGPNGCDTYGQEWDIQECIGRNGDFDGSYFANGMHSNAHYWYTDCEGKKHDYRAPQVRFENAVLASKDFHVYGGWWKDEKTASYYYDNRAPKHQKFYDKVSAKPMDKPMYMRLVSETYPYPWISLPTDEELADDTKNTVYYDWVRAYKLVDANKPGTPKIQPESVLKLYDESILFSSAVEKMKTSKKLVIHFCYQVNEDKKIKFVLFAPDEHKILEKTIQAYAGYANPSIHLNMEEKLPAGMGYKLVASLRSTNKENTKPLDTSTLYINLIK